MRRMFIYLLCVCQGELRVPSCWYPLAGRYHVSSDLPEAGKQEGEYQLKIEKERYTGPFLSLKYIPTETILARNASSLTQL